jgi:hypothetical protein
LLGRRLSAANVKTVERFTAKHQAWQLATPGIYFPQKLAQQFDVLFRLRVAN